MTVSLWTSENKFIAYESRKKRNGTVLEEKQTSLQSIA